MFKGRFHKNSSSCNENTNARLVLTQAAVALHCFRRGSFASSRTKDAQSIGNANKRQSRDGRALDLCKDDAILVCTFAGTRSHVARARMLLPSCGTAVRTPWHLAIIINIVIDNFKQLFLLNAGVPFPCTLSYIGQRARAYEPPRAITTNDYGLQIINNAFRAKMCNRYRVCGLYGVYDEQL